MRRRAVAVVDTQVISPVMAMLVALVIALILLLAAPVKAQETTAEETTAEETTVLAADAANRKVEAETSNTSVEVDKGEVSVSTDDGSSSDDGTSQQSSLTVQQNQTDEGSGSRASTGDVNIGATRRNNSSARVEVDVLDNNGNRTGDNFTANGGNDVTETIPEGDGFFSLDITADNASYNITVEDCDPDCNNPEFVRTFSGRDDRRTDDFEIFGNSFRLRIETDRVDGDRDRNRRHHDRDRNRRHHDRDRNRHHNRFGRGDFGRGAASRQYERIVEEKVIRETVPDKGRLAATGGVPLTGAVFLGLASVGLGVSILRFAIRRDP
jgi:Tfp pilus assembly protein FimT